jgi:nicotinamidase-related amidase
MSSNSVVEASSSALLLMDFQPRQVARIGENDKLVARVAAARAEAKRLGLQVVHVRVAFSAQDFASIPSRNKAFGPLAGGGASVDGTPDTEIIPELAPEDGDIVVTKTRFGAFSTTNLDVLLRGRGIDTLFVSGISTSGVVLSTVRDAGDRDYRLFLLADGCADPDAELHDVLVEKVLSRQAEVASTADLATHVAAANA